MHAYKHLPGHFVGLQNIIPEFEYAPKSVYFAEIGLVTDVIELDVKEVK